MLIISYKASKDFKNFLKENGHFFLETTPNLNLDPRIGDHPDLSLFKIADKTLVDSILRIFSSNTFSFN